MVNKESIRKGTFKLIILMLLLFALMLVGCRGSAIDTIEEMREQLEELDTSSYSEIREWIDQELPGFEKDVEEFELTVGAYDPNRRLIEEGFYVDVFRFGQWEYVLSEDGLEIRLVHLHFKDAITANLSERDNNSLEELLEIIEWIEENKDQEGVDLVVLQRIDGGNYFTGRGLEIYDGEKFFLEWDFLTLQLTESYRVRIELRYNREATIVMGETFELAGVQFTFNNDIFGGRIEEPNTHDDRAPYVGMPVLIENVTDELIELRIFFEIDKFAPTGEALDTVARWPENDIIHIWDLEPRESIEAYVHFFYVGEGEYVFEISYSRYPFVIEMVIPVYDVEIPDEIDRYNRDVEIPEVRYDLDELILFDHYLAEDSFFHVAEYESLLGNTYRILQAERIEWDGDGFETHTSLRVEYTFSEANLVDGVDAVTEMLEMAWDVQQGDWPYEIIGDIIANEERTAAFIHTRQSFLEDDINRFVVIQTIPDNNEIVVFEASFFIMHGASLEGSRRAAIEEFIELTGLDIIEILMEARRGGYING